MSESEFRKLHCETNLYMYVLHAKQTTRDASLDEWNLKRLKELLGPEALLGRFSFVLTSAMVTPADVSPTEWVEGLKRERPLEFQKLLSLPAPPLLLGDY